MSTARSPLEEVLCIALVAGLVLVAVLPSARGMSTLGWLPMWLVGMPAVAWWSLRRFALPEYAASAQPRAAMARMRRGEPQARRALRTTRPADGRRAA